MVKLKFAFFGTPDVARNTLEILKNNGYLPSLIITSPDRPSGRGLKLTPTPVSYWAEENNITCLKPEKIDENFINSLPRGSTTVDLYVVVAYGKILPQALIDIPKLGTINIHYSLLPKYRGASPVEQALLNGDTLTGVTIQQMAYKLDSGAILAQREEPVAINDAKESLLGRLIKIGAEMLIELIPSIQSGNIDQQIQDESKATHCSKIKKEDGEINTLGNAQENYDKYRAYHGWPGIYFFKDGKRIKITKARLKDGQFIIERVIPEGKKEIDNEDFLKQI